jgi:hypothetical protein
MKKSIYWWRQCYVKLQGGCALYVDQITFSQIQPFVLFSTLGWLLLDIQSKITAEYSIEGHNRYTFESISKHTDRVDAVFPATGVTGGSASVLLATVSITPHRDVLNVLQRADTTKDKVSG